MTLGDWVPQIIYLVLVLFGLFSAFYKDKFLVTFTASTLVLLLLYWGGFFDALIAAVQGGA